MGRECGFRVLDEELFFEGEPISSTRIRGAIRAGDVARAAAMLGRPYVMDGIVSKGEGLGRKLGYPTINLAPENELFPADGVYVSRLALRSGLRPQDAVTNVGTRPTVFEEFARTREQRARFRGRRLGERCSVSSSGRGRAPLPRSRDDRRSPATPRGPRRLRAPRPEPTRRHARPGAAQEGTDPGAAGAHDEVETSSPRSAVQHEER